MQESADGRMFLHPKNFSSSEWKGYDIEAGYPVNEIIVNGFSYHQLRLREQIKFCFSYWSITNIRQVILESSMTPRTGSLERYIETRSKSLNKATEKEILLYCIDDLIIDYDLFGRREGAMEYFLNTLYNKPKDNDLWYFNLLLLQF